MVTGTLCLVGKYPQPTEAAGPVSSSITETGAARRCARLSGPWRPIQGEGSSPLLPFRRVSLGQGKLCCFTVVQNLLPGPEPALFPKHNLNSDTQTAPTPLSPQKMFPESVLGAKG